MTCARRATLACSPEEWPAAQLHYAPAPSGASCRKRSEQQGARRSQALKQNNYVHAGPRAWRHAGHRYVPSAKHRADGHLPRCSPGSSCRQRWPQQPAAAPQGARASAAAAALSGACVRCLPSPQPAAGACSGYHTWQCWFHTSRQAVSATACSCSGRGDMKPRLPHGACSAAGRAPSGQPPPPPSKCVGHLSLALPCSEHMQS
jgi:hypothetical protein